MSRITKSPEERKTEIMNAAWELFNSKGYEKTSVNDILQRVGIAKGTFYYYFKSKDEVLDAVIERGVHKQIQGMRHIVEDSSINAIEKIKRMFMKDKQMHTDNAEFLDYLHKKENIVMHQKSLVLSIKKISPMFSEVIMQGIREKLFYTEHPLELTEFILTGFSFLFDPSIFPWSKEEYKSRFKALEDIFETTLRAEKGSFSFLSGIIDEMLKHCQTGR
ncbi:MAG: TetR/AcrR family transcriptional regulator [Bacillota bacterium]